MEVQMLTGFLMWCTIINGVILTVSAMILAFAGDWVYCIQSRWYPLSREAFNTVIYAFVGVYKLFFLMFNLVPYVALLIIT